MNFNVPFNEEDVRKDVVRRSEREKRETLMADWMKRLRERAEVKTFIDRLHPKIYAHFWYVKPKPSDCAVAQTFQFVQ